MFGIACIYVQVALSIHLSYEPHMKMLLFAKGCPFISLMIMLIYAVVVCDSSATANHLYMTLDSTEFLKTANVFDLQFIRDSMEFKRAARDVATEAPPSYKEPDSETPALQPSKVKLTWDDDEPDRKILRWKSKEDQLDDPKMFLPSDDSASDDDVDDSGDESLPNGVAKRKLINKERLALLLQGDKSDEEQSDGQGMEITFNMEPEDLSKRILERKSIETKIVWETHQEKMKEKRKARKRSSKDDDDYSDEDSADENDDFFEDEKADEEVRPIKKQKVKTKGKAKDKLPEEHFEPEATKEELELLVAADQDAANGAKGCNIKRRSKKSKGCVEDKLPEINISTDDLRFSATLTDHLYALDPTDPQYKRYHIVGRGGIDHEHTGFRNLSRSICRRDSFYQTHVTAAGPSRRGGIEKEKEKFSWTEGQNGMSIRGRRELASEPSLGSVTTSLGWSKCDMGSWV
ncbi:hypothetical protein VPH35_095760 [Triticum aestivum]|uniref:pre-rRNA-processing protein ESF1 n=1 Tax=Triticum aestivum TaxID=4565 RepID=UPI001D028B92|nr:pre-rRNA-processing protein ESF1-like [Triticum aestivum]